MTLPVQPGISQTQFESLRRVAAHVVLIPDRTNNGEREKNPNKPPPGRKFEG